jgi:nicotinamidase-related amidase
MPQIALLTIDMQKEYFEEGRPLKVPDGAEVLANVIQLQESARESGVPLVHIQHISLDPEGGVFVEGTPFADLMSESGPVGEEKVFVKRYPSAFAVTQLDGYLKELGVDTLVITGLMSFMCCDTTARDAHSKGYKVLYVQDATAAIDLGDIPAAEVHKVTVAVQGFLFSEVVTTEDILKLLANS